MMGRKLAIACIAAVAALAMTACGETEEKKDPPPAGQDAGQPAGPDAGLTGCTPACGTGYKCVGNTCVKVQPDGCDPACAAGQTCDLTQTPPVCAEICNVPYGCKPNWEVCNETTKKCEGLSCGGAQCELGQGCFDPLTFEAGAECTCLPEREDAQGRVLPDSCASYGKVCDYDERNPAAAKCRPPEDKEPCIVAIGCSTGLTCTTVNGQGMCLRKCQASKDCPSIIDYCVPNSPNYNAAFRGKCWYNLCGQDAQGQTDRTQFFKTCDTGDTKDGTCVPYEMVNDAGDALVAEFGLCYQSGSAPTLGQCDPDVSGRDTAGTNYSKLCPIGQLCGNGQPDPADATKTIGTCTALCNAGPGPGRTPDVNCGATSGGDYCLDVSSASQYFGVYPTAVTWMKEARLGMCVKGCNLYGSDACPKDVLGNNQGCTFTPMLGSQGYCTALSPTAGAAGATCSMDGAGDSRAVCGDRLFCAQFQGEDSGTCEGFCNVKTCADDTAFCAGCEVRKCETCTPACGGKVCGVDANGCPCGTCADGQACNAAGQCEACTPACDGKVCGDNGCGGTCGTCADGKTCDAAGQCIIPTTTCVPNCANKTCGSDGCGGVCGSCAGTEKCAATATDRKCFDAFRSDQLGQGMPLPDAITGACANR